MKRLATFLLSIMVIASILPGCAKTATVRAADVAANDPVTLTMFCSWTDGDAKAFAEGVYKKLPHITLDYEICPIGALPYADEVNRRVRHGVEADIFMTSNTDLWSSGKLMNLTDEAFVSQYNLSIMKTMSNDGSVYFVPGLGDVLCYLYNAKWLDELGLLPPQTQEELNEVFAAMKDAGKQPFMVPYSQTPTQYIKVLISGYLSTPHGQQWMNDYNQGKTNMSQDEHWQRLWKLVEEMSQNDYLRTEHMTYTENMRITTIQDGNAFMTTFSSSQYGKISEENKAKFRLLPLMGEKPENQMVYTEPTCYFAVSNRLAAPENEAKRSAALQLLEFISTTEGQELLRGNNPLAISYLTGTFLPVHSQCANLEKIIKQGAYTQLPVFARGVEKVVEEMFGKLVEGKATAKEAIEACDAQNARYAADVVESLPVLGTATETFLWSYTQSRTEELALTNFCVDSVRKAAGTDYALELGTAFRSEFFKGDITSEDVNSVIRQEKKLYIVEITGKQVWDIINQGVILQRGSAWFIVPSGFCYSYRRLADGTGELLSITTEDGIPLDFKKTYSVAVSQNQIMDIPNVVNFAKTKPQELPFTLREAVMANIQEQGEISPKTDGRIQIVTP